MPTIFDTKPYPNMSVDPNAGTYKASAPPPGTQAPNTPTTDQSKAPIVPHNGGTVDQQNQALTAQIKTLQDQIAQLQQAGQNKSQTPPPQNQAPQAPDQQSGVLAAFNALMGKQATTQQGITAAESTVPDLQTTINQQLANYGLTPDSLKQITQYQGQVNSINSQIQKAQLDLQNQIYNIQNTPGIDQNQANAQIAKISRDANYNIANLTVQGNYFSAQAQMLSGDYQAAQQSAQNIVAAATHQEQQKVSDLQWGMQNYSSIITGMTTAEQNAIQSEFNNAQTAYQTKQSTIQQGLTTAIQFATLYGDQGPAVLKSVMGQDYIDNLKQYGIDLSNMVGAPTITQQAKQAQYGFGGNSDIQSVVYNDPNSIAAKTNNPLNIKYTPETAALGATDSGIKASDGGTFASFPNPQAGISAAQGLLQSPMYQNMTVDQALKTWSGGGYGAKITQIDGNKKISALTSDEQNQLIQDMIQNGEGSGKVLYSQTSVQALAQSIENGLTPPPSGMGANTGIMLQVKAQLAKDGFNLAQATLDWTATNKYVTSANSQQQLRLKQAINSVSQGISGLRADAAKWNNISGIVPLNKANLAAALNGAYGNDAQTVAADFQQQATIIQDELGQTFMGGNSPTDKALDLAGSVFNTNWSNQALMSSLDQLDQNLQYRQNAIAQVEIGGVGGNNLYAPSGSTDTSSNLPSGVSAGSVISYNGKNYTVDAQGNMTPQ